MRRTASRNCLPRRLHRARRDAGQLRAAGGERLRHVRPARLCPQRAWATSRSRRAKIAHERSGASSPALALAATSLAAGGAGARPALPARPRALPGALDRDRRRQRPPAARLHHGRRQVAAQDHGRRRRSGLSRPAQGLRGPPLRRSSGASTRWPRRAPPANGSRAAASCRAPRRISMQAARLLEPRPRSLLDQGDPVGARAAARMALLQARGAGDLPHAGADGRQSRGRARRLLRLFRQGAEAAQRRRSRPAGRHPAIARAPPARPRRQSRRRPRRDRVLVRGLEHGVIDRALFDKAVSRPVPDRTARHADAGAASRGMAGRPVARRDRADDAALRAAERRSASSWPRSAASSPTGRRSPWS